MLVKNGKYIARWTDANGVRRSKACDSKRAAEKLQGKERKAREAKKAQPRRTSAKSSRRTRKGGKKRIRAAKPATASVKHSDTSSLTS
jgi:hypothetical protein